MVSGLPPPSRLTPDFLTLSKTAKEFFSQVTPTMTLARAFGWLCGPSLQ